MTTTPTRSTANSWDALKCAGLALMLCDHAGAFLWLDEVWLRGIGRGAMPIFLFLAGYAAHHRQDWRIITLGLALSVITMAQAGAWFPLNMLLTISLCRLFVARAEKYPDFSPWGWMLAMMIFAIPSMFVFEYGSLALMVAFFGYMQRHEARYSARSRLAYGMTAFAFCAWMEYLTFQRMNLPVMLITFAAVLYLLWRFRLHSYAAPLKAVHWIGRNSLYIYAVHLAALLMLFPEAMRQW